MNNVYLTWVNNILLLFILKELEQIFKARKPSLLDSYYNVGDLCLARYPECNEGWYRGIIVKQFEVKGENGDTEFNRSLDILFADYGETKRVLAHYDYVRKALPKSLLNVPIQVKENLTYL